MSGTVITSIGVRDIRFPTSLEQHGSDAMVSVHVCLLGIYAHSLTHTHTSTLTLTIRVRM